MSRRFSIQIAALTVGLVANPFSVAHELLVGQVDGQIVMHFEEEPFELVESEIPGFPGFADVNPGFVALSSQMPDLSPLPSGADLEWELLGHMPQILVLNDAGTAYMNVGDTFHIGTPIFHSHPLWHSPNGVPGEVYTLSLRLHDLAGLLTDSEEYTIAFTPIPEPSGLCLFLLAAAARMFRR
jgi:hypothetical protein